MYVPFSQEFAFTFTVAMYFSVSHLRLWPCLASFTLTFTLFGRHPNLEWLGKMLYSFYQKHPHASTQRPEYHQNPVRWDNCRSLFFSSFFKFFCSITCLVKRGIFSLLSKAVWRVCESSFNHLSAIEKGLACISCILKNGGLSQAMLEA